MRYFITFLLACVMNVLGYDFQDLIDFMDSYPSGVGTKNSKSTDTFYGANNPALKYFESNKSINKEKITNGIAKYSQALTQEEQQEIFDMVKPQIEKQSFHPFISYIMANMGLMWAPNKIFRKGKANQQNEGKIAKNIKQINEKQRINQVGQYNYFETDQDNNPLPKIPQRLLELISKKIGFDITDYDALLINIYPPGRQLGAHVDHTEDVSSLSYPIVSVNLGADGNFRYEEFKGNKPYGAYDRDLRAGKNVEIKKGDIVVFGKEDRLIKHTAEVSKKLPKSDLGVIDFSGTDATINSLDNYRINLTFRKAGPSTEEFKGQYQKTSAVNDAYNAAVIKRLKKAMPQMNVVLDENLNAAGELDADGKTVRINPNYAKLDTPIHEFAHALIDALGGTSNPLIAKGIEQLKNTDLWKAKKKAYPELSPDMLAKEVLAEAIGIEGANIFKTQEKQTKFKNWLDLIYFKIRTKLGIERNVAKQLAYELLSGRKLDIQTVATGVKQLQKPKREIIDTEAIAKSYKAVKNLFRINDELHVYEFIPNNQSIGNLFQSVTTIIDNIREYSYTGRKTDLYDINSKLGTKVHKILEDIVNGKSKESISKKNDFTSEEVFNKLYDHLETVVERIKKDGAVISEVVIGNVKHFGFTII